MRTPWDAAQEAQGRAYRVGGYSLALITYDRWIYPHGQRQEVEVTELWIENAEGEGMACPPDKVPEGVDEAWMHQFWKENF